MFWFGVLFMSGDISLVGEESELVFSHQLLCILLLDQMQQSGQNQYYSIICPMQAQLITESMIYDDLSSAIKIFKNKMEKLLKRITLGNFSVGPSADEEQMESSISQLIGRYEFFQGKNKSQSMIFNRYLCRVRDICKVLFNNLIKVKPQIANFLKEVEGLANKQLGNISLGILLETTLIEIPNQLKNVFENGRELKIKLKKAATQQKITTQIENQTPLPQKVQQKTIKAAKSQTKSEDNFNKRMEVYLCMDIDTQVLRKRYFQHANSADRSKVEQEMIMESMFRNRHLKNQTALYQKCYIKYKQLSFLKSKKKKKKSSNNFQNILIDLSQDKRLLTANDTPIFKRSHEVIKNLTARRLKHQTNMTIQVAMTDDFSNENSYRTVIQTKLKETKSPNTSMRIKNIVIGGGYLNNRPKNIIFDVNERRKDFYRKTQQHLRLRYKYMNRKDLFSSKSKTITLSGVSTFNF